MNLIQLRSLQWSDQAPDSPGLYLMRCFELDYKLEEVRVFERDGLLIADDQYLGPTLLTALHDGLTFIQWAKKYQPTSG